MPQPAALWSSPRNVFQQRLIIFSSEYYQLLIATHLPTPEGSKAGSFSIKCHHTEQANIERILLPRSRIDSQELSDSRMLGH